MKIIIVLLLVKLSISDKKLLDIGVMFTEESDIYISHTHWLIVADVGVTPFRMQVKGLYEEIQTLGEVQQRLKMLANDTELIEIEMQEQVIDRRAQDCLDLMQRWGVIEATLKSEGGRMKRELIKDGDVLVKFLFGTPSKQDLSNIGDQLLQVSSTQTKLKNIVELQATILINTWERFAEHSNAIKNIDNMLNYHEKELNAVKLRQQYTEKMMELNNMFQMINTELVHTINRLGMQNTEVAAMIAQLANRKLPMQLIPYKNLQSMLSYISKQLPSGWSLIMSIEDLWGYFKSARVSSLVIEGGLRVFIPLKLRTNENSFVLNKVTSVPVPMNDIGWSKKLILPEYIAVSRDGRYYVELTIIEINECLINEIHVCPLTAPIRQVNENSPCVVRVFSKERYEETYGCLSEVVQIKETEFRYAGGVWIYTAMKETDVKIYCEQGDSTVVLKGVGTIELPASCSGFYRDGILQPSTGLGNSTLRVQVNQIQSSWKNSSFISRETKKVFQEVEAKIEWKDAIQEALEEQPLALAELQEKVLDLKKREEMLANEITVKGLLKSSSIRHKLIIALGIVVMIVVAVFTTGLVSWGRKRKVEVLSLWNALNKIPETSKAKNRVPPSKEALEMDVYETMI